MRRAAKMNVDLKKERDEASVNVSELKRFIGHNLLASKNRYEIMLKLREKLGSQIPSLIDENFYNLERKEKYEMVLKKSLELITFAQQNNIDNYLELTYIMGMILGSEKQVFGLHFTMFVTSLELWSTDEQKEYWRKLMKDNQVFGTYIQTEIGHGTFIRGLETTATYDRSNETFVINSPTLTSIKFWPGSSGKSCNFAIVMAQLIIDDKDYGLHAFVVQLRSLDNHTTMPGIELGDIGSKHGYDAIDNGFIKFTQMRIPRMHMLMQFAEVSPRGEFKKKGNELIMYATMLVMRGVLSMFGSLLLSLSTTIAIRYNCVRRQTANANGIEPQIIDYKTQQYRLFPALATTYAIVFSAFNFRDLINTIKKETDMFKTMKPADLTKLHAVSSGFKAIVFDNCLDFSRLNRLCCGAHGYSAASGIAPIVEEADAGCTYEGDNVVMYLQTARYLLKCAQNGVSPHVEWPRMAELRLSSVYTRFKKTIQIFHSLYNENISEITNKMLRLLDGGNMSRLEVWNESSVQLVRVAKIYMELFIIYANISSLHAHLNATTYDATNHMVICDLFELYLTYCIIEKYATDLLKFNIVSGDEMNAFETRLYELFATIRPNALVLVDAFDWPDSNLASSIGAYDGNVYERLLDFARKSPFNDTDVHDVYAKVMKPFGRELMHRARL